MFGCLKCVTVLWSRVALLAIVTGVGLPSVSVQCWGQEKRVVAIYNDSSCEDKGVWQDGIFALKAMLTKYGYCYREVAPNEINTSDALIDNYKIIIFPGGWAGTYNLNIKQPGFRHLREFVARGGAFFGICAGAYFACDIIIWKPDAKSPEERYDYPLNLFEGIGRGGIPGIKEWTAPTGCASGITRGAAMVMVKIDNHILSIGKWRLKMLYYGGPIFVPSPHREQSPTVKVAATYMVPGSPADGKPAMIYFRYGKGKVFLSGVHPEISFDDCKLHYDDSTWRAMDAIISLLLGND